MVFFLLFRFAAGGAGALYSCQGISGQLIELAERFLGLLAEFCRSLHHKSHIVIAADILAAQGRDTLAAEADLGAGLCAGLDIVDNLSVNGINHNAAAESSDGIGNFDHGEDIDSLALEGLVGGYNDFYQQVAPGTAVDAGLALFTDANALTIVNACRNRDIDGLAAGDIACAAAVGTFILDDLAAAAAVRAGLDIPDCSEEGLLCKYDLALAAALGAHLG